jgi:hypothetical protein
MKNKKPIPQDQHTYDCNCIECGGLKTAYEFSAEHVPDQDTDDFEK